MELAQCLLELLMSGADPGVAAKGIKEAGRAGLEPDETAIAAWIARVAKMSTASYKSLLLAYDALECAEDLLEPLIEAAVRDAKVLPLDRARFGGIEWSDIPEAARWSLVKTAIEDAANASQVSGSDADALSLLALYFEQVVPTLLPEPLHRLEWWFNEAREVSRQRDTDLSFGDDVHGVVDAWLTEASSSDHLPALLRLAMLLQRPVWGASGNNTDRWLNIVYDCIGAALPAPRGKKGRRPPNAPST